MAPGDMMDVDHRSASAGDSEPEAAPDLMVVSRARRSNAGNRMSTLLAKSAEEDEWGEEWEEAANEEEFVGDDGNDQDDYNVDSSSSDDDDDDEGGEDDAGEKELRKTERQERIKKRRPATNPFAARLAAAARKRVKLDVPSASPSALAPRPKKKSERASWIPTPEDGPVRTSSRKQTVANKEHTLVKLKEKDRKRDATLAMMKAAEARKAKDEPKTMTQAERLAEAARVERVNSKSLHRWEVAEEQRAAERQANLDALKNRQIDGPFIRYYSGPAIWVDDKLKHTGKDAPKIEDLEEKLNKDPPLTDSQPTQADALVKDDHGDPTRPGEKPQAPDSSQHQEPSQIPPPQTNGHSPDGGSHSIPYPSSIMFAPPQNQNSFLFGIEQYAQQAHASPQPQPSPPQQTQPLAQYSPQPTQSVTQYSPQPTQQGQSTQPTQQAQQTQPVQPAQNGFSPAQNGLPQPSQSAPSPVASLLPALPFQSPFSHPHPLYHGPNTDPRSLLAQFQKPPPPPAPPRKKLIRRAMRNLLILSSFPSLDDHAPSSSRSRTTISLLKEKDRSALIQLSSAVFGWSTAEATSYVTSMLNAPKSKKDKDGGLRGKKELCAVSNAIARYRDPETGIAYRDARAFGVLRGVVGGGFRWSGGLGCYVGGRAEGGSGTGSAGGVKVETASAGLSAPASVPAASSLPTSKL
ncbi:YL1-domain-containing protein [Amniculicola lignicola CBS 123094]|uniref:YL1-domain-containing protein n=1 Tax=Amniculicola lignicola CBS 123094 TaxID=1392246 RepID=A0A6A5W5E6_9PLEO|nr:YL1-domain-containing protein [Amniculicola lignicola CBS 123094]